LRQVGRSPKLYHDARSAKYNILCMLPFVTVSVVCWKWKCLHFIPFKVLYNMYFMITEK